MFVHVERVSGVYEYVHLLKGDTLVGVLNTAGKVTVSRFSQPYQIEANKSKGFVNTFVTSVALKS